MHRDLSRNKDNARDYRYQQMITTRYADIRETWTLITHRSQELWKLGLFCTDHVHRAWKATSYEHVCPYLRPIKRQAFVSPLEARDNFEIAIGRSRSLRHVVTFTRLSSTRGDTRTRLRAGTSIPCSLHFPISSRMCLSARTRN